MRNGILFLVLAHKGEGSRGRSVRLRILKLPSSSCDYAFCALSDNRSNDSVARGYLDLTEAHPFIVHEEDFIPTFQVRRMA